MPQDIQTLKQQFEDLQRQVATKEGQLSRLEQEREEALVGLKDLGVETPQQAEAKITELEKQIEVGEAEVERLLREARAILDGEASTPEADEGEDL